MGAGMIAAYGRPGEVMRYYEINPRVIDYSVGRDPYFTFVRDSAAKVEARIGDGRLSLERELQENQPGKFDVLLVDALASLGVELGRPHVDGQPGVLQRGEQLIGAREAADPRDRRRHLFGVDRVWAFLIEHLRVWLGGS